MKTIKTLGFVAALAAMTSTASAQSWLTNGLVAYYPFNGNANDASGNGHNGTVNGAMLTTNRFGEANHAYRFGGTAAYITAPLTSTVFSNDFTASVWFNASDIANSWPTLLFEENQSLNMQIAGLACGCANSQRLIAYGASTPSGPNFNWLLTKAEPTPIGTYCQVVITKAGANATMYLNAQIAATSSVVSQTVAVGTKLWVGRAESESGYAPGALVFHGVLDDIRIYNRALSSSEVAQLYAIESSPRVDLIKAVKPAFSYLWVGTNYQLQLSTDMSTWTNHGSPFTATNASMVYPQYWDVDNWDSLFFRLHQVP